MNAFQTYIAIIKGYCGAILLFTPKAYANGGLIWSNLVLVVSGGFTTVCALKLIQIAKKYQCYSYSKITKKALGWKGKLILNVMITLSQFCFTITSIAFLSSSTKDVFCRWIYGDALQIQENITYDIGDPRQIWTYGSVIIVLLSLLAFVRNIVIFSFTFLIANLLMLSTVIIVSSYSLIKLWDDGIGTSVQAFNTTGMATTMGFVIYVYEGIGILMPVMQACDCPEVFDKLLISAVGTLTVAFMVFGTFSYLAYGNMKE